MNVKLANLVAAALGVCIVGGSAAEGAPGNPIVEMTIEGRGKVVLQLSPKDAPKTVAHISDLIRKKFYDGIVFHRVVPGFVVQAGDPKSKTVTKDELKARDDGQGGTTGLGDGGSGLKSLPLEIGSMTHEVGTLGMARSMAKDSGDSQWFINLKPNHGLDGGYCVFGKVVKGMDVVAKIQRGDRITKMAFVEPAKPRK